ncbi:MULTISPECIES: phosphate ABC transporter permease subunit PstC [Aminobacterium]|jgi:phosphate transport system permease protein|uniref:phosphate ABC transporter permease subunit PstC n=1 Tax=Aminobacterium TaxID=81466 RepID=UPI0016B2899D|nr:phosphate ABC transporter permease subunit PstC [Aminobacterium sp. EBM-42]MDD2379712.1 phosphate ABC transporter permease subunit PstC [Aminobacterium colombiense]MDD3768601.1 phosphate ABC transporter permease subunit PstC [Aminobacterium colombiense]MDD4265478.1 phosphate ABC transporter permease subunit PstC [Aminobacterium colombiense]MDD4586475.1 phosphate ABC transporter permease subunit PstC [Aminobacterium colombiense]NLK30736.1 phosphate ABC transporter permease subunit PstC [Amin
MKKEQAPGIIIMSISSMGIFIILFILFFLIKEGLPVLKEASLLSIVTGSDWYPTETPPALGMLPLIVGSVAVTILSSLLALPISLFIAIFISEIASEKMRNILKPILELLGFLPSIILGFLGMVLIAPWLQANFTILSGLNLLNASILLGFLIIPIVGSLAEEALSAVPLELRNASYALGATRWETISKVVFPAALPGILSACLLGIMRGMGETMVVLMAAGGAAIIPASLFDPVRPLTSTIAAEMGETPVGSPHYHALFFAGLILLIITLAINLLSSWIESKRRVRPS